MGQSCGKNGMGDEKLAKTLDAQTVEGQGGEGDGECDGRTALRDLARLGGEWRTTANERESSRMIENIEKSEERKDEENDNDNHGQPHP